MKKEIYLNDMTRDENLTCNFTYKGIEALYNYFENYEEETEQSIEYDAIAIRCNYTEYEDFKEIQYNYCDSDIEDIEDLRNYTTVIEYSGGIIIQDF